MGLIGRRVGDAQQVAPAGGVQILDDNYYFSKGFEIVPNPAAHATITSGGVVSEYTDPTGDVWKAHIFNSSGTFVVSSGNATV